MSGRAADIQWMCMCPVTAPGESVVLVGAHEALGYWNPVHAVPLTTDEDTFPMWHCEPIVFAEPLMLEYKYLIKGPQGIKWEPLGCNRVVRLRLNSSCVVENIWGDYKDTAISYSHMDIHLRSRASSQASIGGTPASGRRGSPESDRVRTPQSRPLLSTPPTRSNARGQFQRGAFILANTGPMENVYEIMTKLGQGTWGDVNMVVHKTTGVQRASKKIPKHRVEDPDRLRQEVDIMKTLDHPNIVRLHETFEEETNIYLVLELCKGGELFDKLSNSGSFNEQSAASLMKQMLSSVAYLQTTKVVHRDLKPENFLFLDTTPNSPIKLADFGLAARFTGSVLTTRAGTPYYVAPEVLHGAYGPACDLWSLGVILYVLLCGYPPFNGFEDHMIMQKVRIGKFDFPESEWKEVSPMAKDLIRQLLKTSVSERISAESALRHPWFSAFHSTPRPDAPLPIDIISKFRRFQGLSRLKRISLTIIAQNIDEGEIENLKRTFNQLDMDGDGVLSINEIKHCVAMSGLKLPADVDDILVTIDTSGTGSIDYTEFIAACLHQRQYVEVEACRAAFRVFDIDGDGKIDQNELVRVLQDAGGTQVDAAAEFLEADTDKNGEITFNEFVSLMRRVPSRDILHNSAETVNMMRKISSRANIHHAGEQN